MHCSQSRGVTVAQVILVHFVEVRILTGLPFLFLNAVSNPAKSKFRFCKYNLHTGTFSFCFDHFCIAKMGLLTIGRLPSLSLRLASGFALASNPCRRRHRRSRSISEPAEQVPV